MPPKPGGFVLNVIAAAWADLRTTFLGTRSRLAECIDGVPILRRTVDRLSRSDRLKAFFVLCPPEQVGACRDLLHGTNAIVQAVQTDPPSWASLVRPARKWSLDGWRGGLGGTASFDEYTDARVLAGLVAASPAYAVLSFPAAAPAIDPALADRMIQHAGKIGEESRLVFTQSPPGVAGILLRTDLVRELADKQIAIGWLFAYKPDDPMKDLIFQSSLCEVSQDLRYASGRLIADTDRSLRTCADLLRDHPDPDGTTIGAWLRAREQSFVEPFPREVEIELTTDDPYPDSLLHIRGPRVPQRGPIELDIVGRIGETLSTFDDSLVVLGGFGDPLRHREWMEVIRVLRGLPLSGVAPARVPTRVPHPRYCEGGGRIIPACVPCDPEIPETSSPTGCFGLAIRTTGEDLTDHAIEALIALGVDVVQFTLDAWTPELYGRLRSPSDPSRARLDEAVARIDRIETLRRQRGSATPIIVPDFTKSLENVHELDAFHDGWLRKLGAVSIAGVSHYGGRQPDLRVTSMAPPQRAACRRIRSRCLVLADGRVTLCDQDYAGEAAIGSLYECSLEELWAGAGFQRVRSAHREGHFDVTTPCTNCDEWHRP